MLLKSTKKMFNKYIANSVKKQVYFMQYIKPLVIFDFFFDN